MGHLLRACALMAGLLLARAIAAQEFPAPTAHVSDFAHLWSAATTEQLNTELTAFAQRTRIEVAIVSLLSLENDTVENVAVRLFKAWGIGKRGEDNGLLLLVAPAERRMHIEVGYGLEARLPDAFVGRTIREVITPRFKAGDYDRGIVEGVQTLVRRLETGETFPEQTVRRATSLWGIWSRAAWFLLLPMFVFLPLVMRRQPILGILGIGVFTVVTGSLLLGFFLLAIAMRWLVDGAAAGSSTGRWRSGGFGGGFGGFGGGFGGFSGGSSGGFGGFGGGRSGGGGASGSW